MAWVPGTGASDDQTQRIIDSINAQMYGPGYVAQRRQNEMRAAPVAPAAPAMDARLMQQVLATANSSPMQPTMPPPIPPQERMVRSDRDGGMPDGGWLFPGGPIQQRGGVVALRRSADGQNAQNQIYETPTARDLAAMAAMRNANAEHSRVGEMRHATDIGGLVRMLESGDASAAAMGGVTPQMAAAREAIVSELQRRIGARQSGGGGGAQAPNAPPAPDAMPTPEQIMANPLLRADEQRFASEDAAVLRRLEGVNKLTDWMDLGDPSMGGIGSNVNTKIDRLGAALKDIKDRQRPAVKEKLAELLNSDPRLLNRLRELQQAKGQIDPDASLLIGLLQQ